MARSDSIFTFGIEEEYLLVDRETRDLAPDVPAELLANCKKSLGKQFSREYMAAQIEVGTPVCSTMDEARHFLLRARQRIAKIAGDNGLGPIAAAAHPFSRWHLQTHTDLPRYNEIAEDLQGLGRRMIINGLHVHVGLASNNDRIRLMNELRPFLPILLALSASSPFWQGEATGLKSYRTAINDSTPRKGIPETFDNWRDYQRTVKLLCNSGVIEDASKIWWDIRPSARFPTLEMRITDVCPNLEDGLCLAAIFRSLCRHLSLENGRVKRRAKTAATPLILINENRWRAQRYGTEQGQIDYQTGAIVPFATALEDLLDLIRDDAFELDCLAEVEHATTILRRGTSADRQLACYQHSIEAKQTPAMAIKAVVDLLIEETVADHGSVPVAALSSAATSPALRNNLP